MKYIFITFRDKVGHPFAIWNVNPRHTCHHYTICAHGECCAQSRILHSAVFQVTTASHQGEAYTLKPVCHPHKRLVFLRIWPKSNKLPCFRRKQLRDPRSSFCWRRLATYSVLQYFTDSVTTLHYLNLYHKPSWIN